MSTTAQTKPTISGPGLKKEGVVVLQTFFIAIFAGLELLIRSGAGIISGLIICVVLFGGIRFGRQGTTYVSVVTPPLAFAATVLLYLVLTVGIKPSRLGLDFVATLASIAPYLLASALYGWFIFLNEKAKARKPKLRD
jgi:TRAP-type C4-dicarboxylate transport system permease large subunit